MCLVEKFTDVYPMEVRSRKVIHQCPSSDGNKTCKHTRVRDCGEVYHARHNQSMTPPEGPPSRYSRSRPEPQSTRRVPPARSRPLKLRFPFLRASSDPVRVQEVHRPRDHRTTLDPSAAIDARRDDSMRSRQRVQRPASPRLHTVSPQRMAGPSSTSREQSHADSPSREARPPQRSQAPRPPRERTPVVERVPQRRREPQAPARVVEVHNGPHVSRDTEQKQGRRKGDRQVRFANALDYEEDVRKGHQYPRTPMQPRRDHSLPGRYRNVTSRSTSPQGGVSTGRPYIETRTPRYERTRDAAPRPSISLETNRPRPRIIQDGNRHVEEAGQRILAEARRRQARERFTRDLRSYTAWRPWNRRSERLRESEIGDEIVSNDKGTRRYGWRWR